MKPCVSLSFNNLSDFPLYGEVIDTLELSTPLSFVEILWDNYCHLNPEEILESLGPFSDRISLHVMMSKFLERDRDQLDDFLAVLKNHVRVLKPIRVSDHLARFRSGHLNVAIPMEHDYKDLEYVCERVDRYQGEIGMPLLLENYASTEPQGINQIEFLDALTTRTGCGLLFDVSNAVVSELNGYGCIADWVDYLADRRVNCHVGSYAANKKTGLFHDTHNNDLTIPTIRALDDLVAINVAESICYERDYNKSVDALNRDLSMILSIVERKPL